MLSKCHWTEHFRVCSQGLPMSALPKMLQMQLIIDCSEELAMSAIAKGWKNDNLNIYYRRQCIALLYL